MQVNKAQEALLELAGVLGLTLKQNDIVSLDAVPFIELLIQLRDNLRKAKQWQLADEVRAGLASLGINLEDKSSSTAWKA